MAAKGRQIAARSNKSKYYTFEPLRESNKANVAALGVTEDNEIRKSLKEFEEAIKCNLTVFRKNMMYPCRMSIHYLSNLIKNIVPMEIFGSKHNFNQFINVITKLCTANIHENISFHKILKGWRLREIMWTNKSNNEEKLIIQVIITLINKIKNEVIRKLYIVLHSKTAYKVEFYPRNEYRSLKDKAVNAMVLKNQLIPYKEDIPKFYSKLMLKPKSHMTSYRPIVLTRLLRNINKRYVSSALRNKGAVFERDLYTAWHNFVKISADKPIYGVKIDLQDAFSNVDLVSVAELVKKFITDSKTQDAILNSLKDQIVQVDKNRFYIWNRGLMQGMRLSSKLCDLYRSFFDLLHLKSFIKNKNFFHRTVDDYFFCSVNKGQVIRFQKILEKNCLISKDKTKTNTNNSENEILYNGRIFDLSSKEVKIHIDEDLQTYRHKSKKYYQLPDYSGSYRPLFDIASLGINSYNFNIMILNLKYNSKSTVLDNYFRAMATVALKVECAINEQFTTIPANLQDFIMDVVKYYMKYVRNILIATKAREETMHIPRKVLKFIGIKAFILIFQKRYLPYQNVIKALKGCIKGYRHPLLGNMFNKLPESFAQIRMKRVLPQYK